MKRVVTLFILLSVLGFKAMAQEQYVEVLVSDTVLAEPQRWVVYLNIQRNYSETVYVDTMPTMQQPKIEEKKGSSVDDLKALVKKYNGEVMTTIANKPGSRYYSENEGSLTATFSSRQSLESVLKAVETIEDVSAQIISSELSDVSAPQNLLYTKLMKAAKLKATSLAQLSGKNLGAVLSVSEVTETESSSLKQFFQTIVQFESKSDLARMWWNSNPDKFKLEKSLKVRFALK